MDFYETLMINFFSLRPASSSGQMYAVHFPDVLLADNKNGPSKCYDTKLTSLGIIEI